MANITFEDTAGNELRVKVNGQAFGIIDKKHRFFTSTATIGNINFIEMGADDFRKIADKIDEFCRSKSL